MDAYRQWLSDLWSWELLWAILVYGLPGLVALLIALFLLKRQLGTQGWRGKLSAIPRGIVRGVGWVWKATLKRLPWRPILIWGPWVLIVLAVLFYCGVNWLGARALEQARADWEGLGLSLKVESYLPADLPAEENYAKHPVVLAEGMETTYLHCFHRSDLPGFVHRAAHPGPTKADLGVHAVVNDWLEPAEQQSDEESAARRGLELLQPIEARMEGLAEAALLPGNKFDGLEETGDPHWLSWSEPLLFESLSITGAFLERGILHLRTGEGAKAARDLETVLRLADKMDAAPGLIGVLVEVAIVNSSQILVWEGLAGQGWSEEDLQGIESLLHKINLPKMGGDALLSEAAYACDTFDFVRKNGLDALDFYGGGSWVPSLTISGAPSWVDDLTENLEELLTAMIPRGVYDYWQADYLRRLLRAYGPVPIAGIPVLSVEMMERFREEADDLQHMPGGEFRAPSFEHLSTFVKRLVFIQGKVDLMRVAVALERYRLGEEHYPETLDELVPTFLKELPVDRVTSGSLHYRIKKDGTPLIYSVGYNEKDDGGLPARSAEHLDWVWHYTGVPGQTQSMWSRGEAPLQKRP